MIGGENVRRTVIAVLLSCWLAFGAGTVTQGTLTKLGDTETVSVTITWVGDASDGTVPATALVRSGPQVSTLDGYSIVSVVTDPGSPAPTDNYDITITDSRSMDLMQGACANRDTSNTESCSADPVPVNGALTLNLSGNSQVLATGTITITFVRSTVAKRGGAGASLSADEIAGLQANAPSAANPVLTQTQGDTYIDGCGTGLARSGTQCTVDIAATPQFSNGTATPTTGEIGQWYFETDLPAAWYWSATDTPQRLQNYNADLVTAAGTLTADLPVIGGGGKATAVGTRSGNTTAYVTTTGTQTSGDCVSIDANGNHVANGAACGGGTNPVLDLAQPAADTITSDGAFATTYDITGNSLAVGDRIEVQVTGTATIGAAAPGQTLIFQLDGVAVTGAMQSTWTTTSQTRDWAVNLSCHVTAIGGTGTFSCTSLWFIRQSSTSEVLRTQGPVATTFDTTQALTISLVADLPDAAADDSMQLYTWSVKKFRE